MTRPAVTFKGGARLCHWNGMDRSSMANTKCQRRMGCVIALAVAQSLGAQAPAGISTDPAVDSASVARAAWREAGAANRRGDLAAALAAVAHAAAAWPQQSAYVVAWAHVAARAGNVNGVVTALTEYADLELGDDLTDTVFNRYRGEPWFPG